MFESTGNQLTIFHKSCKVPRESETDSLCWVGNCRNKGHFQDSRNVCLGSTADIGKFLQICSKSAFGGIAIERKSAFLPLARCAHLSVAVLIQVVADSLQFTQLFV